MKRILLIFVLCMSFFGSSAIAEPQLVENVLAVGATVTVTSSNGTCKIFTNNCAQPVFVGFHTNAEVNANPGMLPACVSITDCTW